MLAGQLGANAALRPTSTTHCTSPRGPAAGRRRARCGCSLVWFVVRHFWCLIACQLGLIMVGKDSGAEGSRRLLGDDISLWIDERQVREFSGLQVDIFVVSDGQVEELIQRPNFERFLPVIPERVNSVNVTWRGGEKKNYLYEFLSLETSDDSVLLPPQLSIPLRGRVPRRSKVFQISLTCVANASGTAAINLAFSLNPEGEEPLRGMPVRFRLQKQCVSNVSDPDCEKKCMNGGRCDVRQVCRCPVEFMGRFCETPLCYPPCLHGGVCSAPGVCSCTAGYQGPQCEGGICSERCQNGGQCVQKDVCQCRRGYYGPQCQFSKCSIPCLNGGRCDGVNRCLCRRHFRGNHCEITVASARRRNNQRKKKPEVYV